MARKTRKYLIICIVFVILLGVSSFISYAKFQVLNPFSTYSGLVQIVFTDKEYVEIQKYPKVIIAKPNASLQDYMKGLGFQEDIENQMGRLHVFHNNTSTQYVMYTVNNYFSKWIWQE
jgi:hypothetical protein